MRIEAMRLALLLPLKAGRAVAISYSTAPKAKISVRWSTARPSTCSGAMYWKVPTIVPSCVSDFLSVRKLVSSARYRYRTAVSRLSSWDVQLITIVMGDTDCVPDGRATIKDRPSALTS